jgi:hypothetical protein
LCSQKWLNKGVEPLTILNDEGISRVERLCEREAEQYRPEGVKVGLGGEYVPRERK